MNEIIEELKKVREEHQITMFEIAQGCQVKERSVHRWLMDGNSSRPHPSHLIKIKRFMQLTRRKMEAEERVEIEKYRDLVLHEIYNGDYIFIPNPEPGEKYNPATYPDGLLWRSLTLWRLKEVSHDASETILVKILEHLAQRGLIKIFDIAVDPSLSSDDVHFKMEIGTAKRNIYENTIDFTRLYRDKPLSKIERERKEVILNIQQRINILRTDKKRFFDRQHGTSRETDILKEIIKEERQADLEQQEAALRSAAALEKLTKEKE